MAQTIRLLLVDDEISVLKALRRLLTRRGFDVEIAMGGVAALECLEASPRDVIITDFKMPGMNGGELLAVVAARFPHIRRVMLSGCAEIDERMDAAFLPKPFDQVALLALCNQGRLP